MIDIEILSNVLGFLNSFFLQGDLKRVDGRYACVHVCSKIRQSLWSPPFHSSPPGIPPPRTSTQTADPTDSRATTRTPSPSPPCTSSTAKQRRWIPSPLDLGIADTHSWTSSLCRAWGVGDWLGGGASSSCSRWRSRWGWGNGRTASSGGQSCQNIAL